jgi:hypothetical protein
MSGANTDGDEAPRAILAFGDRPLSRLLADTQETSQTFGRSQEQGTKLPQGGRTHNDFEDSDDDDLDKPRGPQDPTKIKKTVRIEDPEYPILRDYTRGKDRQQRFSSSRRISSARYEYVTATLELLHRTDNDGSERVTLYHALDDDEGNPILDDTNIIAEVGNKDEFANSIALHPRDWYGVVNKFIDLRESYDLDVANATTLLEQASEANTDTLHAKALLEQKLANLSTQWNHLREELDQRSANQGEKITSQEISLEKARSLINRVRGERKDYKSKYNDVSLKLEEAEANLASALDNNKQRRRKVRDEFDPSDSSSSDNNHESRDNRRRNHRSRSPTPPRRSSRKDTPVSRVTQESHRTDRSDKSTSDPRYPNVRDYHGKDTEDLEQWCATAETKFNRSWANFPDEWSKIEYLRGYTKDAAYQVVKLRALPQAKDPYTHRQQLYNDLYENFGIINRTAAALGKIAGGDYKQGAKESISTWVSRFNLAAIDAGLDDNTKLFYALQNLNSRFKAPAAHNGVDGETWAELVARLRNT